MGLELLVVFAFGTAFAWLAGRKGASGGLGGNEDAPAATPAPATASATPATVQPSAPSSSAFPGGPQGLEESVAWIVKVDPKATPTAVRAKLRQMIQDSLTVVAIPSDTSYFAFWLKFRGSGAATLLSDDDARAALDAVPAAFSSQAFLAKGGKLYRLTAPIVASITK